MRCEERFMKIAAVTRFKVGALFEAMAKAGITQRQLAEASGLRAEAVGRIVNLRCKPSKEQCDKIQRGLAAFGIFLDVLSVWPDTFKGFKRTPTVTQVQDVEPEQLECFRQGYIGMLEAGQKDSTAVYKKFEEIVAGLPDRDKRIVEGLARGKTLRQIAAKTKGIKTGKPVDKQMIQIKKHELAGVVKRELNRESIEQDNELGQVAQEHSARQWKEYFEGGEQRAGMEKRKQNARYAFFQQHGYWPYDKTTKKIKAAPAVSRDGDTVRHVDW